MKFAPKTEAEIAEEGLLPDGEYDAVVFDATDKVSKAGNEMIELILKVYDDEGRTRQVRDWLLESNPRKLRRACDALGLMARYDEGDLDADDFVDKPCRVKIGRSKPTDAYPVPNNTVADYVVGSAPPRSAGGYTPKKRSTVPAGGDLDDEIPFSPSVD